jgi:hypothetical protein
MRKPKTAPALSMKIPPKRVRKKFLAVYEMYGCVKAINYLSNFYKVERMYIIIDGKKVGRMNIAYYIGNHAYFRKQGLDKQTVLHEFYHHLVERNQVEIPLKVEEREADVYSKEFIRTN